MQPAGRLTLSQPRQVEHLSNSDVVTIADRLFLRGMPQTQRVAPPRVPRAAFSSNNSRLPKAICYSVLTRSGRRYTISVTSLNAADLEISWYRDHLNQVSSFVGVSLSKEGVMFHPSTSSLYKYLSTRFLSQVRH